MSSNGEDVIRETFEKLGDAIGVQMQMPDAMITNLGAVLQAQIDLLAELQSAGRLIPAGGMALTAEQVEDVRIVLGLNGSQDIKVVLDAQARLRALFPATEPTSYCSKGVCSANEGHDGTCAEASGWAHDAYEDDPAPAVPAEEETKAEEWPVHDSWCTGTHGRAGNCIDTSRWIDPPIATAETHMEKMVRKGSIAKFLERTLVAGDGWHLPTGWDPGVLAGAIVYGVTDTSSPVVPAPTETEAGHA